MSIKEQLEGLKTAIQMIQTSINDILNDLVSKLVDKLIEHELQTISSDSEPDESSPDSPESDRYMSTDELPPPPLLIAYRHRAIYLPDEIETDTPVPRSYVRQQYDQMPHD